MIDGRIEVGIVPYAHRKVHLRIALEDKDRFRVIFQFVIASVKELTNTFPEGRHRLLSLGHQIIQDGAIEIRCFEWA